MMTTATTPAQFLAMQRVVARSTKAGVLREAQRLAIPVVEDFLNDVYQQCGADLGWDDHTPSLREMECVLFDLACSRADAKTRAAIDLLTKTQRLAICQRVR